LAVFGRLKMNIRTVARFTVLNLSNDGLPLQLPLTFQRHAFTASPDVCAFAYRLFPC
jgi:hypothetical protein